MFCGFSDAYFDSALHEGASIAEAQVEYGYIRFRAVENARIVQMCVGERLVRVEYSHIDGSLDAYSAFTPV